MIVTSMSKVSPTVGTTIAFTNLIMHNIQYKTTNPKFLGSKEVK